jgi:hypothetical protein
MLEETLGCGTVPPVLHQDVQHDAMLIHRPPQIVRYASDTAWLMISAGNRCRGNEAGAGIIRSASPNTRLDASPD